LRGSRILREWPIAWPVVIESGGKPPQSKARVAHRLAFGQRKRRRAAAVHSGERPQSKPVYVPRRMSVVVVTPDIVGERMAGPGIRAYHFAAELAKRFPTTLVAKVAEFRPAGEAFAVLAHNSAEGVRAMREADVLIGQPARGFRRRRNGQRIAFDLFDPVVLELRELYGNSPSIRQRIHLKAEWWRLRKALRTGDLLISATAAQQRFYRGVLACGVPWIDVPFGVDLEASRESQRVEMPDPPQVIWGGGVWEWLDPDLAVEAIVQLNREGLPCRLLFLGRTRPNSDVAMPQREERFDAMLRRGAPYVIANESWVPYRERLAWLRRGKVAIMLHLPAAEAEYSIRTRLFDAIAAGVPVVATEMGFAAELVEREGLGVVVKPSRVEEVAGAVRRLLTDDVFHTACVRNLERIRPRFAWEEVARPLVEAVSQWQRPAQ
ncbi:MAG TPA: glycosyltransferase family 4 protein, partial [Thermoanaerobaculia bacterium]|nr:glycosyltransferase family 4 protein [Thermoanaerobaculia bacterium]